MVIQTLVNQLFNVFNVNENKTPVNRFGFELEDWQTLSYEELCAEHNYNVSRWGMRMGLQENGRRIMALDFDCCGGKDKTGKRVGCPITKGKLDEYLQICETKNGMFLSSTEGNRNVLIDYTDCPDLHHHSMSKFKYHELEILLKGNQVIPPSATMCKIALQLGKPREFLAEPFYVMTPESPIYSYVCGLFNTVSVQIVKISEVTETKKEKCNQYHTAILDNINPKYFSDYDDWIKFIWAIRFTFDDALIIADKYSKKSKSYVNIRDVEKYMNSATEESIGWGYLMNLSKKSNYQDYKIVLMDNKVLPANEYDLAACAIDLCDDIIKVGDSLYVYEKPYWVLDTSKKQDSVSKKIMDILRPFFKEYLQRVSAVETTNEEDYERMSKKIKKVCSIVQNLGSISVINNISSMVRIQLPNSTTAFDNHPYVLCFKNCAFDLKTNKSVQITKEHYITQHTRYDYCPSTPTQLSTLNNLIKSIFPKEEELKCYVSIMRSCCIGIPFEKFIMANGSGGNGKGVLNGLLANMLGTDYYAKGNISSITETMKGGPNAELASFHKKRFIRFAEISQGVRLNLGSVKDITGGEDINARALYSNNTITEMRNTTIFECNKKPSIDGCVGDAEIRRFINVPFRGRFTADPRFMGLDGYTEGNPFFKSKEFQDEYKNVLFNYLLQSNYLDIYEPACVRDETYRYLCDNDPFTAWMDATFEITNNKTDMVSIKTITSMYKELYLRAGTRAFKTHTKEIMLSLIDDNLKWKHNLALYYKNRIKIDGKEYSSIFTNLKMISDNEDNE